jgi:hypothetical protein
MIEYEYTFIFGTEDSIDCERQFKLPPRHPTMMAQNPFPAALEQHTIVVVSLLAPATSFYCLVFVFDHHTRYDD